LQAFPTRWLRLPILALVLLGSFTFSASSAPGDGEARVVTPELSAVPPFHSIVLTTMWFSPNADIFKTIGYSLVVEEPGRIVVEVGIPGDPNVLLAVQNDSLPFGQSTSGAWNGRDAGAAIVPDGMYEFRFTFVDTAQNVTSDTRQFKVDTVFPVVDMVTVDPRQFTPTVPGSVLEPLIGFRVTMADAEDNAGVRLVGAVDTLQVALSSEFQGNGTYSASCIACADSLSDGIHRVEVFAVDRAGNVTTAVDSIDMNIIGPEVSLLHPTNLAGFVTAAPDSITGTVMDRHLIGSLSMLVSGAMDTTLVLVSVPGVDSTQFHVDVSQLFAAEGVYDLAFRAMDEHGASDTTRTLAYTVDRSNPPAPILSPPLSPNIRTADVVVTVLVESTAKDLHIQGAAIEIQPITITGPEVPNITLPLKPGANTLVFFVEDFAGNLSLATIAKVFRETSEGISAPEHFRAGQEISIDAGDEATGLFVRIMALDGAVVWTYEDPQAAREYAVAWDLTTEQGRHVRNGAYLVMARVKFADGATKRYRKMIAVIE